MLVAHSAPVFAVASADALRMVSPCCPGLRFSLRFVEVHCAIVGVRATVQGWTVGRGHACQGCRWRVDDDVAPGVFRHVIVVGLCQCIAIECFG